jgi:hemerythrin-like domain-containing protein
MTPIERLLRDHQLLRAKLEVLEAALRMGPEVWFVLREVCFTLSRQLQSHIRREEALLGACRSALGAELLHDIELAHRDEPQLLRMLNRLFVEDSGHSLERIRPVLMTLITGLRRHMDEEEEELFPALERTASAQEPGAFFRESETPPASLDEVMTVNYVVHAFPDTRPTFERLFINVPLEGCTCLDEVAWRHGMESQELLQSLEEAIWHATPST